MMTLKNWFLQLFLSFFDILEIAKKIIEKRMEEKENFPNRKLLQQPKMSYYHFFLLLLKMKASHCAHAILQIKSIFPNPKQKGFYIQSSNCSFYLTLHATKNNSTLQVEFMLRIKLIILRMTGIVVFAERGVLVENTVG